MAGVAALQLHPHEGDKYTETFIEGKGTPGSVTPPDDLDEIVDFSGVNEKAVVRKCDWHIVPWLSLLYLLSFLDRTNIGNANLFGLSADLKLNPTQYAACLALFFAFYVLFEVPSNMVMKRWRPSMWLPIIMLGWGGVMVGMGFVQNYVGLLVARIFLGITEAGLFPGVSYFLTLWYRRYEINFRIALFFSAATAAGAFGGLLARLINFMDGVGGYQGWRWIFILEGIATVLVAAVSFWMLHDYPSTAKFLTPVEKACMMQRLKLDGDGCSNEYKTKFIWQSILDWKTWASAMMFHFCLMPVYSFSLFSPTLTANLGYAAATAQLLSVPPYVLAAITTIGAGWISDRLQQRGTVVMVCSAVGTLGYLLNLVTNIPGVNYFGLFLAAAGMYPLIPVVVSWGANQAGGSLKRGITTAIIVSVGNAGGIISAFTFPATDKPRYYKGHAINTAYCAMTFITALIMHIYYKRENARREQIMAAHGPYTAEEKAALSEEGDRVPWFKYAI